MNAVTKNFILAGRAIFTIEIPDATRLEYNTKPHYTFRVNFSKAKGNFKDTYFVSLLTGPENTTDYSYLGMLNPETGEIRTSFKSCRQKNSFDFRVLQRSINRIWAGEQHVLEQHGFKLHHEGRCCRCGRPLTTPESCETGIGPECADQMGITRKKTKKVAHGKEVKVKVKVPDVVDAAGYKLPQLTIEEIDRIDDIYNEQSIANAMAESENRYHP